MAIILAIAIGLGTLALCALMIMGGLMRTTGATRDHKRNIQYVFTCGMLLAILIAGSHWIGW